MKPRLKKILLLLIALFVLFIGLAASIAYLNEEKIKGIAIEQLNKLLNTEVSVESIEFSLLKRFPRAAIQFNNINIQEKSDQKDPGNLIEAQSLFLEFDPFDLLSGTYIIDRIFVSDATFNIHIFKDGSNNFQFFESDSTDEQFQISLQQVVINKSTIHYTDEGTRLTFSTFANSLALSGEFGNDEYDLNLSYDGDLNKYNSEGFSISKTYPMNIDLILSIQHSQDLYTIKKARTDFGLLTMTFQGTYKYIEQGGVFNVQFNSDKFSLNDVREVLPDWLKETLIDYHAKGNINIDGSVVGTLDSRNNPLININCNLEEGYIDHKTYSVTAKNIVFKGAYTNGPSRNMSTSSFIVEELSFDGQYGRSQGSFSIVDFKHPLLSLELSSSIDLANIRDMIQSDSLEIMEGKCQLNIKGSTILDSLSSIGVEDIKTAKAEGNLRLESGKFKWKGIQHSFDDINASCRFGNNLIHIDSLTYSMAGIESTFKGKLHNFLPFIFYKGESLTLQAEVYYKDLNLNALFETVNKDDESGIFLPISESVKLNLVVKADQFEYRKFNASNVSSNIISKYPYLIIEKLSLDAMEGHFDGWMQFNIEEVDNIVGTCQLALEKVNINALFEQFENFGQTAILAENLKGFADAEIDFYTAFDRDFNFKQESIKASTNIIIKNGALVNYKPILALSKYIAVEELENIAFSKLSNNIEIKNRMVYIPEMLIKSSALELSLSGKHSFDNEIDYRFQLYLNDFLFKKAKKSQKNQDEFGEVEVDDAGRAKLYMHMTGTVDDYKIKFDRKALREKWKSDMKKEGSDLRDLFKSEFGGETKKKNEAPAKFDLEWEEFNELPKDTAAKTEKKSLPKVKDEKPDNAKKNKFGKSIEDEYETYDSEKLD